MEDKGLPDFNGKVVVVYLDNAPRGCEDGVVMEYPAFEKRNERIYLRGRIPELEGQEWVSQCQTAVTWDSVIHYIEFKTIEEYRKRTTQFKPSLLDRLNR